MRLRILVTSYNNYSAVNAQSRVVRQYRIDNTVCKFITHTGVMQIKPLSILP